MRSRSTGSSGASSRSCRRASTQPAATAAASSASTPGTRSPCPSPSTAEISSPKARAFSTALVQSNRRCTGGTRGSVRQASASASSPTGTLIANSHGQGATDRIAARQGRATAEDTATTSAFSPMPAPSRAEG